MKKIICFLIVGVLALSFTACNNKKDSDKDNSLAGQTSSVESNSDKEKDDDKKDNDKSGDEEKEEEKDLMQEIEEDERGLDYSKYSNDTTLIFFNEVSNCYYFLDIPVPKEGAVSCYEVIDCLSTTSAKNLIKQGVYNLDDGYDKITNDGRFIVLSYSKDNTYSMFGRSTKNEIISMLTDAGYEQIKAGK